MIDIVGRIYIIIFLKYYFFVVIKNLLLNVFSLCLIKKRMFLCIKFFFFLKFFKIGYVFLLIEVC